LEQKEYPKDKINHLTTNKNIRVLIGLIKMCLNETYNKVHTGKHLSDMSPIQNGLKQGEAFSPWHFNFALNMQLGWRKKTK
jgi:hypothetical protein